MSFYLVDIDEHVQLHLIIWFQKDDKMDKVSEKKRWIISMKGKRKEITSSLLLKTDD